MKFRFKHLNANNNDSELYFGVIMFPIACLASLLAVILPEKLIPVCAFHRITGRPCPTCGAYRSIEALISGHPAKAFLLQPLVMTSIAAAGIYFIYSCISVIFHLPRLRLEHVTKAEGWILVAVFIVLVMVNWSYLIANGR